MNRSKPTDILAIAGKISLADANEAETRFKIIDKVIRDILEWTDDDIYVEERVSEDESTTFADYIIRTANTALVIEAKRIGVSLLEVPKQRKVKLTGKIMSGQTGEAIKQARDYCRKKSIPHGVVTNGDKWIVFPATRTDQIEFAQSHAIVFDSLKSALGEEIEYFKLLLSRDRVIEGKLDEEMVGRSVNQIERRRLNTFHKGSEKPTNPIYPLIEDAIVSSFSDSIVDSSAELLEKCYVKNAERTKFDNKIQMHLKKREPIFRTQPKRPMKSQQSSALVESIESSIKTSRSLAILILGTVGSGKTTFLEYTRKVSAKAYFEKAADKAYPHWIGADFRTFSPSDNPFSFIYSCLFEYIKKDEFFGTYDRAIRSAYKEEISALKQGPMAPIAKDANRFDEKISEIITNDYNRVNPYVEKLIKYSTTKSPVYLVIDNVDQFEDVTVQSKIFSEAIAIAIKLNINLIMAMRESTYVQHRNSPIFDAFDFDPFQIEPPQINAVLSRRFLMAREILKGRKGEFQSLNGANFQVEDLSVFIDIVSSSVLGTEVGTRIEVLANNDVRLALRMTREFLSKGYTDPAKAINVHKSGGEYVLPKQEAFRAILLGNQAVYTEEYSVIGNPFDSRQDRTEEQLLRLFILNSLVNLSSESSFQYINCGTITEKLKLIGFSEEDSMNVLSDLCKLRFIHTSSHNQPDSSSNFYPSRLGGFVVRDLLTDFTFIETVLMDTFIANEDVWQSLTSMTEEIRHERDVVKRIQIRIDRVNLFYEYMIDLYSPMTEEANKRGLEACWLNNPLKDQRSQLDKNLAKVLSSAQRNYGNSH